MGTVANRDNEILEIINDVYKAPELKLELLNDIIDKIIDEAVSEKRAQGFKVARLLGGMVKDAAKAEGREALGYYEVAEKLIKSME